jgi:hypothetical protein
MRAGARDVRAARFENRSAPGAEEHTLDEIGCMQGERREPSLRLPAWLSTELCF